MHHDGHSQQGRSNRGRSIQRFAFRTRHINGRFCKTLSAMLSLQRNGRIINFVNILNVKYKNMHTNVEKLHQGFKQTVHDFFDRQMTFALSRLDSPVYFEFLLKKKFKIMYTLVKDTNRRPVDKFYYSVHNLETTIFKVHHGFSYIETPQTGYYFLSK